jgi:hypothetical protein
MVSCFILFPMPITYVSKFSSFKILITLYFIQHEYNLISVSELSKKKFVFTRLDQFSCYSILSHSTRMSHTLLDNLSLFSQDRCQTQIINL